MVKETSLTGNKPNFLDKDKFLQFTDLLDMVIF